MDFVAFADRAAEIEAEPADIEIRDRVTDLLQAADEDLPIVARFVQGRVFPGWDSRTLDVGPTSCYEAIARAAGPDVNPAAVEDRLAEQGDVGAVAASFDRGGQQGLGAFTGESTASPTVLDVYAEFERLASTEGEGSHGTKVDILFGLFNRATDEEARYLARLVLSEMRIGVGEGTVRDAIANAFDVPVDVVERALQVSNDYGRVAVVARDEGESGLQELTLEVGRPVKAMLAQAGTVTEALDAWDAAAVEWKYDGARVQVHYDGSSVRLFSRNMEDVTDPLPEIVDTVEAQLDRPAILDGEVVAIDEDGSPRPFQEILRRFRRKYDVEQVREDVAVELRLFDCLHVNGNDLLDAPLSERRGRLEALVDESVRSEFVVTGNAERIEAVDRDALEDGHEGIMLKDPDSAYTPGRRGKHWLKRKPDVETLDLVVTGAEWGEGRRASLLGTFEVSARTPDGYARVGNVATGITDEELEALTDLIEPHVTTQSGQDVTVEPSVVFEVGYEEIQSSPTYDSGYALRFPRFVGVREDKDPADADSVERIQSLAGDD
ncbi:MAG TPA: ATP-dependent DNA ligase LigA [Natrialbaceae archaeon]|nr:ATP-dependent DNA ligase LigA [Natrialbaceae archaeon]